MYKKIVSLSVGVSFLFFIIICVEIYYLFSLNQQITDKNNYRQNFQQKSFSKKPSKVFSLKPPPFIINKTTKYTALMKTTAGDVEIELYADKTPITVNNFIYLVKNKVYEGTQFNRIIKNLMIQGGDPTGTGSGGPGYQFNDEPFNGEYTRGTIAMATAGKNSNGSQFFIMQYASKLSKTSTIFGKVIQGIEVIDAIAEAPTKQGDEKFTPINPITIESIIIQEK